MSNYNARDAVLKFAENAGVKQETPLLEALKMMIDKVVPMVEATNTAITMFEKIGKGKTYVCPHCKSDTLLEYGNCHVCEQSLFVETLNLVSKKSEPTPPTPDSTEKKDLTLKDLNALLEKANDKKNKNNALLAIASAAGFELAKPDIMTVSAIRSAVITELEKMIKALKAPKVIEVDEDEIVADMVELDEEEEKHKSKKPAKKVKKVEPVDEDDDIDFDMEDDEDDEEEKPKKSTKKAKVVIDEDEDELADEAEEKPKSKKPAKKSKVEADEDEDDLDLDDDDLDLNDIELDDDDSIFQDDDEDDED